jgi:hypothetical protein
VAPEQKTSDTQLAANRRNAAHSTGPRTPEGRARAAANSTTFGLFTASNHVEPHEEAEYAVFVESWRNELAPHGPVEDALAIEIVAAAWRLRRCGIVESNLLHSEDPDATQLAVDRARNQAHRLFLKGIAELRKLQTERQLRSELNLDSDHAALISFRDVVRDLSAHTNWKLARRRLDGVETVEKVLGKTMPQPPENKTSTDPPDTQRKETANGDWVRFVNPPPVTRSVTTTGASANTAPIARNALCPCKSGQKFKRCCGRQAPPLLNLVANNARPVPASTPGGQAVPPQSVPQSAPRVQPVIGKAA